MTCIPRARVTRVASLTRTSFLAALIVAAFASGSSQAATAPTNLGYGLDKLVASEQALRAAGGNADALARQHNGYATDAAAEVASRAITEAVTGKFLVDITLTGRVPVDAVKAELASRFPQLNITAVDKTYRKTGIIEGYAELEDITALSQVKGVRAVFLGLKPDTNVVPTDIGNNDVAGPVSKNVQTSGPSSPNVVPGGVLNKLGTAFDQGVFMHRVDKINQYYNPSAPVNFDGAGITVAAMSDSYDVATTAPRAAIGVANFDLPGSASNPVNTQPVVIQIEGPAGATDEGRAMVEIIYKMAPRARLGFASGSLGEVAFGNSIRSFAQLPGFPGTAGFRTDVIVDDISYGGEPFYGESIIGNAIDEAAAAGVSYFSSAGNNIGINAYESALRVVPNGTGNTAATNAALVGTNIDLTNVPANLYAGGFHNFNPASGQLDVAQLVNMPTTAQSTEMQWDDPYDVRDLVLNQPAIFSSGGSIPVSNLSVTFDGTTSPALPIFTAGTPYVIQETASPSTPAFDGIVDIYDPSNTLVVSQDTGTDETVNFYPSVSGQYRIVIRAFGTTTGNFSLTVNTASGMAGVTSDLNLLVFSPAGAYVASRSLTTNNLANNRPVELGQVASASGGQIQFVIARANIPATGVRLPTRVRWSVRGNGAGNIGPAEYFSYNATTTKGHASAKGCNGTAAYSPFRPNLPESFTSPGPATIFFDKDANLLPVPEIRQVPRVAATDAANNSFFGGDSSSDLDTNPNFSGTSAAAPHAAAIAALILQSRGGPGSITPAAMTKLMQNTAFPHDLDPSKATGTAATSDGGTVTLVIDSDNDTNLATGENDPSSWKLSYSGAGSIASITFNPAGTATTGGNATGGNSGIQDNLGSVPATVTYFENNFPGTAFLPATRAFLLGPLTGLAAADVTAPVSTAPYTGFSNLVGAPGNGTSQFWTMTVGFPNGNFSAGKVVRFTVGRGAQHSSTTGNGVVIGAGTVTRNPIADILGGGVFLPSGIVVTNGMTFSGTTTGGGTFTGTIKNNIGNGYSPVDGYGMINAEGATDLIFRNGFDSTGN
ncbi:MAG: S8 family serine peptidase [Dokdonella sp.]